MTLPRFTYLSLGVSLRAALVRPLAPETDQSSEPMSSAELDKMLLRIVEHARPVAADTANQPDAAGAEHHAPRTLTPREAR